MLGSSVVPRGLLPRLLVLFAFFAATAQVRAQVPGPLPAPRLDLTVAGEISSVAAQADGGLILVGKFSSINGTPRDGIARLSADGSLDPLWYPRVRWTNREYATQRVHALPDGSVLLFGEFDRINDQFSLGCGEKLSADPSPVVITSWRLNVSCLSGPLAFDDDGWVYFFGAGVVRRARTDTGEHDPNWGYPILGAGMLYDGRGGLVLYDGMFLTRVSVATAQLVWQIPFSDWSGALVGGGAAATPDDIYLAFASGNVEKRSLSTGVSVPGWPKRLSNDPWTFVLGDNDTLYIAGVGWAKAVSGATGETLASWKLEGIRKWVRAIERRKDGRMIVAGNFARVGTTPALGLAELASPTSLPVALAAVENRAYADRIVSQPDGHLIVSGQFDRVDGIERQRLLRLLPDGTLDSTWAPRVDEWIRQMTLDSQGDLYLLGNFESIDGHEVNEGLAKIDGKSGSVVSDWQPWLGGDLPTAVVVDSADRVYVSAFSRSTQPAYRLLADGSTDPGWNPSAPPMRTQGLQRIGGHIYAVGFDAQDRHVVRRMDVATGTVDPDWRLDLAPLWDESAIGLQWALTQMPDGDLLIGGSFDSINGVARSRLARISSTAPVLIRDWNPAPNASVSAFGKTTTGRLFVGGTFTSMGGKTRNGVAELDPADGVVLDGWVPPSGGSRMAVADDRIYFVWGLRGVIAYPLNIGDTIFATPFD
jgi:hypothetical protein